MGKRVNLALQGGGAHGEVQNRLNEITFAEYLGEAPAEQGGPHA